MKTSIVPSSIAGLLLSHALFIGCAGNSSSNAPVAAPATLASIEVTPSSPDANPGGTKQFKATGTYSDSTTKDLTASVAWTSSDITKATIDPGSGLSTAVAVGPATITAALDGITQSTVLTVHPNTITGTWPSGQVGSQTPAIVGPSGTLVTTFGSYGGVRWNYVACPFTVDTTGIYSAVIMTTPVMNTTYFLKGLFEPGYPATTPLSSFFAEVMSNQISPWDARFSSLSLTAGQQYSVLVAFNVGGTYDVDSANITITGPGCVVFSGH